MTDEFGYFYNITKTTMLWAVATAAVFAGIKIFSKWNRSEDVLPLIFAWLLGMVIASGLFMAVDAYIIGSSFTVNSPVAYSKGIAVGAFEASLYIGISISIVSLIRIYIKMNNGENVHGAIFTWFGSLIFLFVFSYIIENLVTY